MAARFSLLFAAVLALVLGGCATHMRTGAMVGGTVGAMAPGWGGPWHRGHGGRGGGVSLGAVVLGAAVGGAIGAIIGREMDQNDRERTALVLENNRTGESSTWVNPDKQAAYTVTPTKTTEAAQGPCREFTTQANIGGKMQQVYGTACRQADGSWQVVS